MSRRWARVAELVATQGLKGRFVARSCDGLPFLLEEGLHVSFVPPTLDGVRWATVASVTEAGGHDWMVTFKEIKDLDAAQPLVGSHCVVAREDIAEALSEAVHTGEALVGFEIHDERLGYVGEVLHVQEMPTQYLLEVAAEDGSEVYIPFVEEFLVEIDEEAGTVLMNLPSGLVDIAEAESADDASAASNASQDA